MEKSRLKVIHKRWYFQALFVEYENKCPVGGWFLKFFAQNVELVFLYDDAF